MERGEKIELLVDKTEHLHQVRVRLRLRVRLRVRARVRVRVSLYPKPTLHQHAFRFPSISLYLPISPHISLQHAFRFAKSSTQLKRSLRWHPAAITPTPTLHPNP